MKTWPRPGSAPPASRLAWGGAGKQGSSAPPDKASTDEEPMMPGESRTVNVPGQDSPRGNSPVPRDGGRRRRRRAEQAMVPDAVFTSYYGRPVIKEPVWETPDVPGYLFLGGLAGASSALAAGAQLSGYGELAKVAKIAALGAISLSTVALVHDLGRPKRF